MRIRVKNYAVPVNVSMAGDYPPGRKEDCLKVEQDMEQAGISRRWNNPTSFCSRAFFILKKSFEMLL